MAARFKENNAKALDTKVTTPYIEIDFLFQIQMNIILWIIFGALAGWVASMIMGTNARQGMIMNIVVGIVGAMIGGFVMQMFGAQGVTGFDIRSFIVAVVGAIILLALYKMITGNRSVGGPRV